MLRIIVNGIGGQMGKALLAAAAQSGAYRIAAGVDKVLPEGLPVPGYGDFAGIAEEADALIDFSVPGALKGILDYAVAKGMPVVLATTGYGEEEERMVNAAAEEIPVFRTANMSLGVNLQGDLIRRAKEVLGDGYDVEIVERHHRRKVDAPSGTALMLAACLEEDAGRYKCGRDEKNRRRSDGEIGIHAVRGGTIVGEHEVMFLGNDEEVEVIHRAYSKQVFANGALRAAAFLQGKAPGRYDMSDLLKGPAEKQEEKPFVRLILSGEAAGALPELSGRAALLPDGSAELVFRTAEEWEAFHR